MKFDMNKMLQEAQRMQAELAKAQEEAASEIVEASAGGGMVTVKANGAGEVVEIVIDPRAIDPDDPDVVISSFSTSGFATDPEDVGYDPDTGHLFIVNGNGGGSNSAMIFETDTSGNVLASMRLPEGVRLQEALLLTSGGEDLVPELGDLRENVTRLGGRIQVFKTAKDYFLASKALPWWAIGASLIAVLVLGFNFLGDGLRDALDPTMHGRAGPSERPSEIGRR